MQTVCSYLKWASSRKNPSSGGGGGGGGGVNNKGADQPAHLRNLIIALFIRFLDSFICKLATGEKAVFSLFRPFLKFG